MRIITRFLLLLIIFTLVETNTGISATKLIPEVVDWGVEKVGAPKAWKMGITGKGIKVAVIDTGIDTEHPDLNVVDGISFVRYTNSYDDDEGHGTHVAGIIGAKKNGEGTVGVAPGVDLYAVKALDYNGNGFLKDIIAGIDWAISKDVDVINLSMGIPKESLQYDSLIIFEKAINRAYSEGILVVAASGNDGGRVEYPAAFSNAIAVSAINLSYNINTRESGVEATFFTSTGPEVELTAPGEDILSTRPTDMMFDPYNAGLGYGYESGTSMATPYVAGIIALIKEANPNMKHTEIRNLLRTSAKDLGKKGKDNYYGYGMVQFPDTIVNSSANVEKVIKDAEISAKQLRWQSSIESTKEIKTPDMKLYNEAKKQRDIAQAAIDKMQNESDKLKYQTLLDNNVTIWIQRAAFYIDAIKLGESLKSKTDIVLQNYLDQKVDEEAIAQFKDFENTFKHQGRHLWKVYGKTTREAVIDKYVRPAEELKTKYFELIKRED